MAKIPERDDILAKNPHIDPEKLAESIELQRKLRESGVKRPGYGLAIPYSRRRISVEPDNDARVIKLRRAAR